MYNHAQTDLKFISESGTLQKDGACACGGGCCLHECPWKPEEDTRSLELESEVIMSHEC